MNRKLQQKKSAYATTITAFLMLLLAFASIASAAGPVTLTPTTQASGGSVTVNGAGFGATKRVAIGFGVEVNSTNYNMNYTGSGVGPYSGRVSNYPIKPGSFVLISDTTSGGGLVSYYNDNGDGTTSGSFEGAVGTIDYVTGNWTRTTTVDVTGIVTNYTATYTRYEYNVTPAAGITTLASGTFTASITVPSVADGSHAVTAIDTSGNRATSFLIVDHTIPEGLTIGAMLLLSTVAVIVGTRYYRKRPKW